MHSTDKEEKTCCCMAEKYGGWCKKEDTEEIDGKYYCIFHAPVEYKKNFDTNFTKSVLEKIESADKFLQKIHKSLKNDHIIKAAQQLAPKRNPTCCNFSGTIFPPITFNGNNKDPKHREFLSSIDFSKSIFTGRTDFSHCKFDGALYFDHCEFEDSVYFSTPVDFKKHRNSIFKNNTYFKGAIFYFTAFFSGCIFEKNIDLMLTKFEDTTLFESSIISGQILGINTSFCGRLSFSESHIDKLCLGNSIFKGMAFFSDSNYTQLVLSECTFEKIVKFDNSIFTEAAEFNRSCFNSWTYFRNVTFGGKVTFEDAISEKEIIIEGTDLSNFPFLKTNIESFKFIECRWKVINNHAAIYDYINPHKGVTPLTLEEIYRRLKNNARKNSDEVQTSNWHYKEKEMQRITANKTKILPSVLTSITLAITSIIGFVLYSFTVPKFWAFPPLFIFGIYICQSYYDDLKDKPHWFSKIYLNLYYFSSRYGESPERASLILICLISSVFFFPFIFDSGISSSKEWLEFSLWFLPLTKIEATDFNPNMLAQILKVVYFLLITIQSTLFAFSLRNRLRR